MNDAYLSRAKVYVSEPLLLSYLFLYSDFEALFIVVISFYMFLFSYEYFDA